MAIILMVIVAILLMVIDEYSIGGYWCSLMANILMAIGAILLVDIGGY